MVQGFTVYFGKQNIFVGGQDGFRLRKPKENEVISSSSRDLSHFPDLVYTGLFFNYENREFNIPF